MDKFLAIGMELLKFIKEKGYVDELIDWLEEKAADTESPVDDFAIKLLKYFLA